MIYINVGRLKLRQLYSGFPQFDREFKIVETPYLYIMKRLNLAKAGVCLLSIAVFATVLAKVNSVDAGTSPAIHQNANPGKTKTAKELYLAYLENINDPDKGIKLFADDATMELPYLKSLGLPWQWKGKKAIYDSFKDFPKTFHGFKFENIRIHIATPDQAFAEYDVNCTITFNGRPYHQTYMGWLVVRNGKIVRLHEALDMVQVAKSMFPNGVADLSAKKKH